MPDAPVQIIANAGSSSPSSPVSIVANASGGSPADPPDLLVSGELPSSLQVAGEDTAPNIHAMLVVLTGEFGGKPYYQNAEETLVVAWFEPKWQMALTPEGLWESEEDVPRPDMVTTWTPVSPATGNPVLERGPLQGPEPVLGDASGSSPASPVQIVGDAGAGGSPSAPPQVVA